MELKNINVIQGQSSLFQDFRCAVRWPGMKKIYIYIFIDHRDQTFLKPPSWTPAEAWTLTPEAADLWGPGTQKQNL